MKGLFGPKVNRAYGIDLDTWLNSNRWVGVRSTNVRQIRYDKKAQVLAISFLKGRTYLYFQADPAVAQAMYMAPSMGRYIHSALGDWDVIEIQK